MSITRASAALANLTKDDARRVYAQDVIRRRLNTTNFDAIGFEEVACVSGEAMTSDGREIVRVGGRAYALRPEVHAERLAQRFEAAKKLQDEKQAAKPAEVTEAIAATTCPQMHDGKPCGGSLNRRGVCPSCVTGKMGYKYRYTCESCGCDIVTREELR